MQPLVKDIHRVAYKLQERFYARKQIGNYADTMQKYA